LGGAVGHSQFSAHLMSELLLLGPVLSLGKRKWLSRPRPKNGTKDSQNGTIEVYSIADREAVIIEDREGALIQPILPQR